MCVCARIFVYWDTLSTTGLIPLGRCWCSLKEEGAPRARVSMCAYQSRGHWSQAESWRWAVVCLRWLCPAGCCHAQNHCHKHAFMHTWAKIHTATDKINTWALVLLLLSKHGVQNERTTQPFSFQLCFCFLSDCKNTFKLQCGQTGNNYI